MTKTYRIALIPGDGIGKEVVPEGVKVVDAAARKFGFSVAWDEFPWSCEYYAKTGRMMPENALETIRRRRFRDDAAALFGLVDRHDVGGLVIGLPLALTGGDTPRTQSVRQFARNLLALRDMPVAFWDERLSTAAVTREMIAHDMTRKRRAEIVDRVAAAYILQTCLDAIGRSAPCP